MIGKPGKRDGVHVSDHAIVVQFMSIKVIAQSEKQVLQMLSQIEMLAQKDGFIESDIFPMTSQLGCLGSDLNSK